MEVKYMVFHISELKNDCIRVLKGKMQPEAVIRKHGDEERFYRVANNLEVEIRPTLVINMLNSFIKGEKTKEQLKEWANFITLTGAFATPNWKNDNTFRYDPMWDVLGRLSTPEIDGELTTRAAKEYITELKLIKEDF